MQIEKAYDFAIRSRELKAEIESVKPMEIENANMHLDERFKLLGERFMSMYTGGDYYLEGFVNRQLPTMTFSRPDFEGGLSLSILASYGVSYKDGGKTELLNQINSNWFASGLDGDFAQEEINRDQLFHNPELALRNIGLVEESISIAEHALPILRASQIAISNSSMVVKLDHDTG